MERKMMHHYMSLSFHYHSTRNTKLCVKSCYHLNHWITLIRSKALGLDFAEPHVYKHITLRYINISKPKSLSLLRLYCTI